MNKRRAAPLSIVLALVAGLLVTVGVRDLTRDEPVSAAPATAGSATSDVVTVTPARLLDSREGEPTIDGRQSGIGRVRAGAVTVIEVAGRGGVAPDARAAMLNVVGIEPDGAGYITVWPCEPRRPTASTLNVGRGQVRANGIVAQLDARGRVCVYNQRATDLVVDVMGYVPPSSSVRTLTPARLLETRRGQRTVDGRQNGIGAPGAGQTIELQPLGRGGVDRDASAVLLNVIGIGRGAEGFVTVWPCGERRPNASTLNIASAGAVANNVVAKIGRNGKVCLRGNRAFDLVVDVVGWIPRGSTFEPLVPARLMDTRPGHDTVDGQAAGIGERAARQRTELRVAGRGGVDADAVAVLLNITGISPRFGAHVRVWPCGVRMPHASVLNIARRERAAPNGVIVRVGEDGKVCLYTSRQMHLVVDVVGAVGPPDAPPPPPTTSTTTSPPTTSTTSTTTLPPTTSTTTTTTSTTSTTMPPTTTTSTTTTTTSTTTMPPTTTTSTTTTTTMPVGDLSWPDGATLVTSSPAPNELGVQWPAVEDATGYVVAVDGVEIEVPAPATSTIVGGLDPDQEYTVEVTATDGSVVSETLDGVQRTMAVPQPRVLNPVPVAPAAQTSTHDAAAFLYSGANPAQVGMQPGALDPERTGIVRGRILDATSAPISGATVSVLEEGELGHTVTGADGLWDLAVNGGAQLVVDVTAPGYLPSQRTVDLERGEWRTIDDIVLLEMDDESTVIGLDASQTGDGFSSHEARTVTDDDGARRARLLVRDGTSADLEFADGSTQPTDSLTVTITEYTEGDIGPAAMPGTMPDYVGYTYAVELTAAEAVATGAIGVSFDQPVILLTDNFLGIPVGAVVPTGTYNRQVGEWQSQVNGIVMRMLGVDAEGRALLDATGDGVADNDDPDFASVLDDAELRELADHYEAGDEFWRSELMHFSPQDLNYAWVVTPEVDLPEIPDLVTPTVGTADPSDTPTIQSGYGLIEYENQSVRERIALAGTDQDLTYSSARVPGRGATVTLPITGSSVPAGVIGIEAAVHIAGTKHERTFPISPNQSWTFTWDGLDRYGRQLAGPQVASLEVSYLFPGRYEVRRVGMPSFAARFVSFNRPPTIPDDLATARIPYPATRWIEFPIFASDTVSDIHGLGGWELADLHTYDASTGTLLRGDGSRERVGEVPGQFGGVHAVAGTDQPDPGCTEYGDPCGDGGPAGDAQFLWINDVAYDLSGNTLVLADGGRRVRRIDASTGVVETIAGGGACLTAADPMSSAPCQGEPVVDPVGCQDAVDPCGDDGPATSAHFSAFAIDVGPDDSVYLLDAGTKRIRRIAPDGTITSVAGTGLDCAAADPCGDDGPATSAPIGRPQLFTVGSDGSIFFGSENRIRRVTPDGNIYTISNGGHCDPRSEPGPEHCGDGGAAMDAGWFNMRSMTTLDDGSLLVVDETNRVIRRIAPDGRIERWAGEYFVQPDPGAGYDGVGCTDLGYWDGGNVASFRRAPRQVVIPGGDDLWDGPCGDGEQRLDTPLPPMTHIETATDGSVFVATGGHLPPCWDENDPPSYLWSDYCGVGDFNNDGLFEDFRLLRIGPDGTVNHYAGSSALGLPSVGDFATEVPFDGQNGFALDRADAPVWPSGHSERRRLWRIGDTTPPLESDERFVPDGEVLHVFSETGRLLRTEGLRTRTALRTFGYDPLGRIATVTDADGNVTRVQRDQAGTPLSIEGPFGDVTDLSVDTRGRLDTVTNPAGEPTTLGYAAGTGLLTSVEGAVPGSEYTFEYSFDGRLIGATDPLGHETSISSAMSSGGRTTTVGAPSGDVMTIEHAREQGGTTQVRTVTGFNGARTVTRIDGTTTTTETPDGVVRTLLFAPDPQYRANLPYPTELTTDTDGDERVEVVTRIYDRNPTTGDETFIERYRDGWVETELVWDEATNTRRVTSAAGRETVETLGAADRVALLERAGLASVSYTYDTQGRPTAVTAGVAPDDRTTTFTWDGADLTQIEDAAGRTVDYTYDDAGRVERTALAGATVDVERDANGNATGYVLPNGERFEQGFDLLDRVDSAVAPGSEPAAQRTATYDYDVDGALDGLARADGTALVFSHVGQQFAGRSGDASTTAFTYDPQSGQMLTAAADATVTFDYRGHLTSEQTTTGAATGSVQYEWDLRDRMAVETVDGDSVYYEYDADNLVIGVGDEWVDRDADTGHVTERGVGSASVAYEYDEFGALARTIAMYQTGSGPEVLFDEQLGRDALGRVTTRTETVDGTTTTWTYGYDARGRLATVSDGSKTDDYEYDQNSNLVDAPNGQGAYDRRDRMESFGASTRVHDAAGDLVSIATGGDTTGFDIDAAGLLRGVDLPSGDEVRYSYDGLDRRVARAVNGTVQASWIYRDGNSPAAEVDGTGNVLTRFVYGVHGDTPDYLVDDGDRLLVVSDFRGSPRLVVDADTGTVVQRVDYDALGAVVADTNPGLHPFGFQGGLIEPSTGLVRFGARDYDPSTGRFVSSDPSLFAGQQSNLYVFGNGDPVNRSDPSGLGPATPPAPPSNGVRTHSVGLDLSGTAGIFNVGINVSLAYDTSGDFGIQVTPSAGGSVGASVEAAGAYSNTSGTIKSGDGPSVSVGGIAGIGLGGGTSSVFNADGYAGQKVSVGIVEGASGNAESGYTFSLTASDVSGAASSAADSVYYAGLGVATSFGYTP